MIKFIAPALLLLLAACATPSNVDEALASANALLAGVEAAAAAYEALPPCRGQGGLCSNPRLVKKIAEYDGAARLTLQAVRDGRQPIQNAINAIASFANLLSAPEPPLR